MGKYCVYCGKKMYSGARFCAKCGKPAAGAPAQMPTTATSPSPQHVQAGRTVASRQTKQPAASRQTDSVAQQSQGAHLSQPVYTAPANVQMEYPTKGPKIKSSSSAFCIVLAIILLFQTIAVGMYGWPGFALGGLFGKSDPVETDSSEAGGPTGYSEIKISKSDYKTKPITVDVGPESTVAEIEGITVDFGEFNLSEEGTLEIRDLGVKKDDENAFSAHCYDFSLGDVSEFPTHVKITLPYEKSADAADRLFMQYYNDQAKSWELLYSQINESEGTITFYTDHFSTYGLFDNFEYEKGYNAGPLTKVFYSPAKLDDMVDKCFTDPELFSAILKKKSAEDSGLIDIAINSFGLSNNITSASDNSVKLVSSTGLISQEISNALGKSFGRIGAGLTAVKLGLSWYESGDVTEAFKKNKYDLIELGLGTAAGALGSAPLTVAAATVWLAGMLDDGIRSVKDHGYENEIEHAYQEFTWEYVSYSQYAREFCCTLPTNMLARAYIDEMKDAEIVNQGNTWAWLLKREYIKNRENPQKIFEAIEKLLDDYANVFWQLKPNIRKMIAEDIHAADRWQEPSDQEKLKYKENLKATMRSRSKKLFACIYEWCMVDAKQRLLLEIKNLENHMNSVTSVSVYVSGKDGKEIPLSKTEYKDYIAAFAKTPDDKPTIWSWYPGSSENSEFKCTLYNYIAIGSPSCIKFYNTWEDQVADNAAFTLSFTYSAPSVRLKIGNADGKTTLTGNDNKAEETEKPAVQPGEGYWKFVQSFENNYETSYSDDNYTSTWSGGGGSYTYRCQAIFEYYSYSGSTHDNCSGEWVENTGTSSKPNDSYKGGEWVEIDLKIAATTSSHICLHLGANLGASITPVNHDKPFVSYGTNTSLYDITKKHTKSFISTYKNDTNTGYMGMSVTVGGNMPTGSAVGDKVYIIVGMGGGNNSVETAYEYEWVVE